MASTSLTKDWRDEIEVGDILIVPSGDKRLVRGVSRWKKGYHAGFLHCVTLAIRNCSWTHRGNTVVSRSDLHWRGFQPTDEKAAVLCDVESLTCCEVKGLL